MQRSPLDQLQIYAVAPYGERRLLVRPRIGMSRKR